MATQTKIKVVLVDDQPLWREGLRQVMTLHDDIEVIQEIGQGEEALAKLQELQADVVLLDISLPGLNGIQVTQQLKSAHSSTAVVILTNYDDPDHVIHAIQSGAAAFCTKDIQPERLVEVIHVAAQGNYVIGDKIYNYEGAQARVRKMMDELTGHYTDEPHTSLSAREMEILLYVTRGYSNKEIAHVLSISNQTVKNHMTAILRKLKVQDRTQAAMYALRHGWIKLGDTLRQDENKITVGTDSSVRSVVDGSK